VIEFLLVLIIGAFLFSFFGVIWLLKRTGKLGREMEELRRDLKAARQTLVESMKPPAPHSEAVTVAEPEPLALTPQTAASAPTTPLVTQAPHPVVTDAPAPVTFEPESLRPASPRDTNPEHTISPKPSSAFAAFVRGGTVWAAGGVLLLIAAFAMFLTYMAHRGFFTLEMRIAAAALAGLVMVVSGWLLRRRRPFYFLILQGGGIGILYLTVFAAYKLAGFPAAAALTLMSVLIPAAVIIAVFQNSQVLAFFAFLGGFAAPVLISDNTGPVAFLFAYYTALSFGILATACARRKIKPWGWTALLGMAACFGFSIYWVLEQYRPADFAFTEPFLALFIAVYTALGIITFVYNGAGAETSGPGVPIPETAVILATPLLGSITQWKVFSFMAHGYALISFAFAVLYLVLAFVFLKRRAGIPPLLVEGYAALALLLANLIIPLELSPSLTSAVWAAEGAVVYFIGLRRGGGRIPAAGLVIHAAAAAVFCVKGPPLLYIYEKAAPLRSAGVTGCLVIAASALVILALTKTAGARARDGIKSPVFLSQSWFSVLLALWGLGWYYAGWGGELRRIFGRSDAFFAWFLIISSLSAALFFILSKLPSPARLPPLSLLNLGSLPSLALAFCAAAGPLFERLAGYFLSDPSVIFTFNYFSGVWGWAWLCFIVCQMVILNFSRNVFSSKIRAIWTFACALIVLPVVTASLRYLTVYLELAKSWTAFAGVAPLLLALLALGVLFRRIAKADKNTRLFLGVFLPQILCAVTAIWFTVTLFMEGVPDPLPFYLPVLNPLEILEALCAAVIAVTQLAADRAGIPSLKRAAIFTLGDIMCFLWITAMLFRSVHFLGNIPPRRVMETDAFKLALFIFWAIWGIGHIIAGCRFALRPMWIAGAALTVTGIVKLILVDMANTGAPARIVCFFIAGLVFLFIGWAAPLPPPKKIPGQSKRGTR
jgi:uncharacterized membrane protein